VIICQLIVYLLVIVQNNEMRSTGIKIKGTDVSQELSALLFVAV